MAVIDSVNSNAGKYLTDILPECEIAAVTLQV
jgi:hypothetical protein